MASHKQKVLAHLRSVGSISSMEALRNFGCFRLAARIYDLKEDGWAIKTIMITTKGNKRIARYRLIN